MQNYQYLHPEEWKFWKIESRNILIRYMLISILAVLSFLVIINSINEFVAWITRPIIAT